MHDDGMNGDLKKGNGIFTIQVPMTLRAATPVFLRVSAGFTGKLERVTCGPAPVTPTSAFLSDFTPGGIQTFLANSKGTINSAATFLQALDPAVFKRDWIVMTATLSSQEGDAVHPRFLLPNNSDSKQVFGIAQAGDNKDLVEYIQWVDGENKFHFHTIDTVKGMVVQDDPSCTSCHSGPDKNNANAVWPYARPNWDAYDSWGGALPYNRDRIYLGTTPTVEQKAMQRLLKTLAADPVTSQLDLPAGITRDCRGDITIMPDPVADGAPATIGNDANNGVVAVAYDEDAGGNVTYPGKAVPLNVTQGGKYLTMHSSSKTIISDEGRGVALFDNLSALNSRRVAQELADKFDKEVDGAGKAVQVVDIRPVALAIAGGGTDGPCKLDGTNLGDYAPQAALDAFLAYQGVKTFAALYADTLTRRQSLPS